ncbi:hypothetical protein M3Y99_01456700 [Aphelenchoides fujianensis]|nr:hypothetical protein M3Y99_01456700 [Aphelenchoides fujianensis]
MGGDQLPLFGLTKTPQELPVPPELADDPLGFTSVVCGTEHVLLLTSSGRLAGVGHANPVTRLTEVVGPFARPRSIYAGHYHSCVIDENNDVFLWGWAVHGQLAMETIKNVYTPTKVDSLSQLNIRSAALGMAHSLFLDRNGVIFGCGFMDNGELLVDPQKVPECGGQTKTWRLIRIEMPEPIELLSSNYFMSVALSKTALYEWGISPHALKLNAFWQKRQNAKTRAEMKADGEAEANAQQPPVNPNDPTATPMRTSMSRDHFKLRRVCSIPFQEISVGYNTTRSFDGQRPAATAGAARWTDSWDSGPKRTSRRPPSSPNPPGIVWSHVRCGRNSTIAVGERGETFVWGRNDRNQLGVPPSLVSPTQQPAESPKRYVLKSGTSNKKRAIELPVSHAVDRPTVIAGVHCGVHQKWLLESDLEEQLNVLIDSCDQSVLHAVGEQLRSTPICSPLAIRPEMSELRRAQTATPKTTVELNSNTLQPPASVADESKNGNFAPPAASALSPPPQPTNAADSTVGSVDVEEFERLIDAAWSLLNAHPVEDVRTVAALTMLCAHFPCINRLAADARLCRLVAAYVELPQTNLLTSSSTVNRKAG